MISISKVILCTINMLLHANDMVATQDLYQVGWSMVQLLYYSDRKWAFYLIWYIITFSLAYITNNKIVASL